MKKGQRLAAFAAALLLLLPSLSIAAQPQEQPVSRSTPYDTYVEPDTFLNGAVLDLKKSGDVKGWLTRELENMRYCYNINTLNIYGLEGFDTGESNENKDFLFAELARLGMKVVVRIESYNSAVFAFEDKDLDHVLNVYDKLIRYVSQDGKRQQVAYFSLNMPVDDGNVQKNLGGVNSPLSKQRQVSYAVSFVKRMRELTKSCGFADAKMYLSIFYGWDNSYQTPSYAPAGADGYFINNYSYPVNGKNPPDASASDEVLINQNRLMISMQTYLSQYPGMPLIVESGFHTMEYNNGKPTNQTAGLVKDREAKIKAMKATLKFYKTYFSEVKGWLYFGYNLYKEEGSPAAVMDWSLVYPVAGLVEAEDGYRLGSAVSVADSDSSGQVAITLRKAGDGLAFYECSALNQLKLRYTAKQTSSLGVYVDDVLKQTLELPAADGYTEYCVSITVPKGSSLQLKLEADGEMRLDSVGAYAQLEAENGTLQGNAAIVADEAASNKAVVGGLQSEADRITMTGVRSGARVKICYKAEADSVLRVIVNGKNSVELALKATTGYEDTSATLNVPAGSTLEFVPVSATGLMVDYIGLSGVAQPEEETESTAPVLDESGISPVVIVLICLGVFLAGVVIVTLCILKKGTGKKESK